MSVVKIQGNASGTGIFTVAAPNSNTDRTLTLPDNTGTVVTTGSTAAVSQAMLAAGVAGTGPAFSAYQSSAQSVSSVTLTKVQFQTEEFDTNSNFDNTTNYRFTPTVAGYYQVNASIGVQGSPINFQVNIYKNGSGAKSGVNAVTQYWGNCSALIFMNGLTDYLEIYTYTGTAATLSNNAGITYFQANLVRAT